jgi:hypothetical protein
MARSPGCDSTHGNIDWQRSDALPGRQRSQLAGPPCGTTAAVVVLLRTLAGQSLGWASGMVQPQLLPATAVVQRLDKVPDTARAQPTDVPAQHDAATAVSLPSQGCGTPPKNPSDKTKHLQCPTLGRYDSRTSHSIIVHCHHVRGPALLPVPLPTTFASSTAAADLHRMCSPGSGEHASILQRAAGCCEITGVRVGGLGAAPSPCSVRSSALAVVPVWGVDEGARIVRLVRLAAVLQPVATALGFFDMVFAPREQEEV